MRKLYSTATVCACCGGTASRAVSLAVARLADRTGSRELTETVRQLLGLEEPEKKEHEEIPDSDPAVTGRGSDDLAAPGAASALSDDTEFFSDDSDMMFTQVKEAWSRLTPSGRRVVWSLVRELSVLKELQR